MRALLLTMLLFAFVPTAADAEPEAPAKATGALSPAEERLQGVWKAITIEYDREDYVIAFDGRDFRAVGRRDGEDTDERYEGYVVLRTDVEPAWIDFVILPQPGRISRGIFRFDGEAVLVKAPEGGMPRPRGFEEEAGPIANLRLVRPE